MIDRIYGALNQTVIGIIGKLPDNKLESICNGKLGIISEQLKAAGLNINNPFEVEILRQHAKLKLENALKHDAVEFNGIYFERESPRDGNGDKILYSYKDSIKRVHSLNGRHAYPREAFSLLIANLIGRINAEQKEVAYDMLGNYGEWLCECERKGDMLIVYLDGSADMELNVKSIPSVQFVDLSRLPDEFAISIYSRPFEELPQIMKIGNRRAQVCLPPEGRIWPLGRGVYGVSYSAGGCNYNVRASRWVA